MREIIDDDAKIIARIVLGLIFLIGVGFAGYPSYNVYKQTMKGEAELAHSIAAKQIQIQDALGKFESAKHLADAEVERAKGVAAANKIIADSLKNNEAYLRYLWIDSLKNTDGQVIYVPTEAGLPILEAGRRK